jgi:predicted membrane metal-binding protein
MEKNKKIIFSLVFVSVAVIAVFAYYAHRQRQDAGYQNAAEYAECQTLGNQFYQRQQAQATANFYTISGMPYYQYSSTLGACAYLVGIHYATSSYGYSGEEDIYDITHGQLLVSYGFIGPINPSPQLASANLLLQSSDPSSRKEFCDIFKGIFSADLAQSAGAVDASSSQIAFIATTICGQQ